MPLEPYGNRKAHMYKRLSTGPLLPIKVAPRSKGDNRISKALGNLREPGRKGNIRTWGMKGLSNPLGFHARVNYRDMQVLLTWEDLTCLRT